VITAFLRLRWDLDRPASRPGLARIEVDDRPALVVLRVLHIFAFGAVGLPSSPGFPTFTEGGKDDLRSTSLLRADP